MCIIATQTLYCSFSVANSVSNTQKDCKMRHFLYFRSLQSRREISLPRLCARGRGSLHTRSCYMQQHTHTEEMAERTRSEVWLNFTRLARCLKCNKSLACQGGNTSNLSKHLAKVHHVQTEKCTGFDCLSSSSVAPSTSNVSTSGILCMLAATHGANSIIQTWVDD